MVQSWKNLQLHWTSGESLEPQTKDTIPSYSGQLQELPIKQVLPNPHQPRKVIDPEAVSELASSIQSEGCFNQLWLEQPKTDMN